LLFGVESPGEIAFEAIRRKKLALNVVTAIGENGIRAIQGGNAG
jgi:hypothetical protein